MEVVSHSRHGGLWALEPVFRAEVSWAEALMVLRLVVAENMEVKDVMKAEDD